MQINIIHRNRNRDLDENGEYISDNFTNPIKVNYQDNLLELILSTNFNRAEFNETIKIDLADKKNKALEIALKQTTAAAELKIYEIFNYVDRNTGLKDYKVDEQKIARIVVDNDTSNVWVQICIETDDIEGFNNEILDGSISSTGFLASKCEWLQNKILLIKKKSKLLNIVDHYSSISYLEAQVDLLTRVLLSIVEESDLVNILKEADKNSVLNIKPLTDIKQEFTENKFKLRKMQEEYYGRIKDISN